MRKRSYRFSTKSVTRKCRGITYDRSTGKYVRTKSTWSKKGQVAIPFAMGWLFFNLILFIMVYAFGTDGVSIGTYDDNTVNMLGNTSSTTDLSVSETIGFIDTFKVGLNSLPFWLNLILSMIDVAFLILIIYALIRGL